VNALNQTKFPHTRLSTPTRAQPARLSPLLRNIFLGAGKCDWRSRGQFSRRAKIFPAHQRRRRFRIGLRLSAGRQSKRHNPDVAEAFMNKDKEVRSATASFIPRECADSKCSGSNRTDQCKTVTRRRIADSIADLTKKAGLRGNIVTIEPTGFEQIAFWITRLRRCCCWAEYSVRIWNLRSWRDMARNYSAICFALFFLGHIGGTRRLGSSRAVYPRSRSRTDRDTFLAHSTIVFGVVGVFLMLGSLFWTMIDRYPGQNFFRQAKCSPCRCQHVHRDCRLIRRHRSACALSAAHEHLPAIRPNGFKPLAARAIRRAI